MHKKVFNLHKSLHFVSQCSHYACMILLLLNIDKVSFPRRYRYIIFASHIELWTDLKFYSPKRDVYSVCVMVSRHETNTSSVMW